jgi:uroporphyrinogen-III synthase
MKILYLGLNPKPGTVHYPVIRTEFCGNLELALKQWAQITHVIFTSQTAVRYWPGPWDKELIAVGDATAGALREKGLAPLIAPFATQEGVIELVRGIKGHFLLPRSKLARSALTDYFDTCNTPYLVIDLYDTVYQQLEPVPSLDDFDEIVFTSPSTVEGFLRIYGKLPRDKILTPIGPITAKALSTQNPNSCDP